MRLNPARATTHFKQLCCLGLPGQMVVPALLGALHPIVPSYANAFIWVDARQQIRNTFSEIASDAAPLLPLYLSEFANHRETEVVRSFSEVLRVGPGVVTDRQCLKVEPRRYYRHDFYNLILRPVGTHWTLRGVIYDAEQALAMVALFRGVRDPDFTASDAGRLAALLPYVAHALASPDAQRVHLLDSEDEGLCVCDERGRLRYCSRAARDLIFTASRSSINSTTVHCADGEEFLRQGLRSVAHNLRASFAGDPQAAAPVWRVRNAWGGFVFRAYWLETTGNETADGLAPGAEAKRLIGIRVCRQEPRGLAWLRRLHALRLSPRQCEVGLQLAQGVSFAGIARRMDLSERTVAAHTRALYERLDVHNRVQLLESLGRQ